MLPDVFLFPKICYDKNMHQEENCIFCKIAKKEIPCHQIYEDDKFLAFLDIKPITDGHLLIIPKKHVVWMQEADDETISEIFKLAKKLMLALKKGMPCDYVQVGIVGNEVPHFHIHLMPRYNEIVFPNLPTKKYKNGQQEELVQKITKEL
jgi:histidine triad (HIT) family protein